MGRLILDGEDATVEIGGVSYTETYGALSVQISAASLQTSITETYGTMSVISVSSGAGVSQVWIAQG